jgi:hypothetical protein
MPIDQFSYRLDPYRANYNASVFHGRKPMEVL